ncbi:hypothetical protein Hesp01_71440 [Herbidospora sp. NBRC 101105]|nr:hypothetical protein Hesp01_71440 [Herbidospora sp. NBRC 101105]
MFDVGADGGQEDVGLGAVDVADGDVLAAGQDGGAQAVHPVDHPHGGAVDEDGRQRAGGLRECADVVVVLSVEAWRVGVAEQAHRNRHRVVVDDYAELMMTWILQ